jgi:RNA polymerase sigma factor (sigma-70 family)
MPAMYDRLTDRPPQASSFDEFARAVRPSLYEAAVAVTLDREVAHDVVQEALLIAHRDWAKVSGLDRPDQWVRRIVVNRAIDEHRRTRRRHLLSRGLRDHRLVAELGDTVAFWTAVQALPRRQRQVVVLRALGELSLDEIAGTLEIAVGTVKATLHAGRANLRHHLGLDEEQP